MAYFAVLNEVKHGPVSEFVFAVGLILGVNNLITGIFDSIAFLQLNNPHIENSRKILDLHWDCAENNSRETCTALAWQGAEIELRNVSFVLSETNKQILNHLNLTICAGEKLAIVGNNGAGKSTLVNLICGLYTPTEGSIWVNGQKRETGAHENFLLCSVVFQKFHLLAASILENISCIPEEYSAPDRAWQCLEKAGLKDKIASMPKGIYSPILKELDRDGVVLSGGEQQKLMLARCLYKNSPVLILDEPTSALDAMAESEIYRKYHDLSEGKTRIFISHRLNSIKFCDRIILLDHGEIIEEWTHGQPLAQNGAYAKMYSMQASYYKEESQ